MSRLLAEPLSPMTGEGELPFELNGWVDTAPFEDLLGISIESCADGEARLSFEFVLQLAQGAGLLHGGALTTLADTAVAMAIKSLLPPSTRFATTELTTRFLAPVQGGRVTAVAKIAPREGRTFYGDAEIFDVSETVVARFRSTFRVARGQGFDDA
ncbi:MAG: PaaI family thioesterase [Desulfuromonas sp.]|nr:MAG: PaaI family thioesterase [Desulfuromonas sp.]